jgi:hypothetical protein
MGQHSTLHRLVTNLYYVFYIHNKQPSLATAMQLSSTSGKAIARRSFAGMSGHNKMLEKMARPKPRHFRHQYLAMTAFGGGAATQTGMMIVAQAPELIVGVLGGFNRSLERSGIAGCDSRARDERHSRRQSGRLRLGGMSGNKIMTGMNINAIALLFYFILFLVPDIAL